MTKMLLTLCLISFLTACGPERIELNPPPPAADKLVCAKLPAKPNLNGLTVITASNGAQVYMKPETDARDAVIARYIVAIRSAHFSCQNALQEVAEYYAEQE